MSHSVISPLIHRPKETKRSDAGLHALVHELSQGADLELLLERFLVSIVALAQAQAGAVRVLTDDGLHMRLVAQQGLPDAVVQVERLVRRDCGVCGRAGGADVLAWVDDVHNCGRAAEHSYFGVQCKRVLAISLPQGGEVLGIYNLFFDHDRPFSAETESILRLIGQMLGLALHNARIERERLRLTVMRERQEMVNEVHDAIAQTVAYVRMRLPLLSDAMLAHDDASSQKYFADVKKAVGEVHVNLREVMTYFRTRMDPLGLVHALSRIAEGFLDRTGIVLELKNEVRQLQMSEEHEVQVFYIVQEALANIAKHSMARRAVISIRRQAQGLEFLIEDDGLGMSSPSVATIVTTAHEPSGSNHLGMDIMRSRARRIGASLEVSSNSASGTRVCLTLPENQVDRP